MRAHRLVFAVYAACMATIAFVLAPPYLWTGSGIVQRATFGLLAVGLAAIAFRLTDAVRWASWLVILGLTGPLSRAAALTVEGANLTGGQRVSGIALYTAVSLAIAHATGTIEAMRKLTAR